MSTLVFDNKSRVMVVAPHPDDETVAAGGLLQQAVAAGGVVRIIFVTSGENNPWPQRAIEHRWHIGAEDRARWGRLRQAEVQAALHTLGIATDDAIFLGFPDQGVTQLLLQTDQRIIARLAEEIGRWQPTLLVGPSCMDIHPDHSAAAVLINFVLDNLKHLCRPKRLEYLVHTRGEKHQALKFLSLYLTDKQQDIKRQAILCHASQLKLQRRKLLAKVKGYEKFFYVLQAPPNTCDYHPVHSTQYRDGYLQLELSLRPHLGAFGRSSIYLVGWDGNQMSSRLVTLPAVSLLPYKRWRQVKIHDCLTGSFLADGSCRGNSRGGLLRLPLAHIGTSKRLFAKLERQFGFFDEAGWRELPGLPEM